MTPQRVHQHWLFWDGDDARVVRKRERTGRPMTPELIVIHYGVTRTLPELVAAQRARGYWAHLSIDGFDDAGGHGVDYVIHQALPFNETGSHAGESEWRGRESCNAFSIGIEIANPGPLIEKDGGLVDVHGQPWPRDEAEEHVHSFPGAPKNWRHWAHYTDQEIDILIGVCRALKRAYPTIVDVVGHDEIAPGRKFDPGPAFPMAWLRETLFPARASE